MSNKKILVSGCGISWSGQERKTWVNILKVVGVDIIDVGGPAVSNQWIINHAIEYTLCNNVTSIVIQLTSLGKLDVDVTGSRYAELVANDTIRNFTIDNVWPSSCSLEHPSKQLWMQWLYSPRLELQDIEVKLELLKFYCHSKNIQLVVLQGYRVFDDLEVLYDDYQSSAEYQYHDYSEHNTVPCLEYQFKIAKKLSKMLDLSVIDKIEKIEQQYQNKSLTNSV